MPWTTADIPDQTGRTFVVTGANAGLGFETTAALAAAGATVVMACRNLDKAAAARDDLLARTPDARVETLRLDLGDQAQIADAATEALERFPRIDVLVNNAGVMSETRQETADGFELCFGTNHLGPFAFTGRVLPALLATPRSRVVHVTSLSQKVASIRWNDLDFERATYRESTAYAQSKLAGLLFGTELQRRFAAAGVDTISLAAHPGFAATHILHGPDPSRFQQLQMRVGSRYVPTPEEAARSQVRAATDPAAYGGQLYGPSGRGQIAGPPVAVPPSSRSLDEDAAARLWSVSERLTGVEIEIGEVAATR